MASQIGGAIAPLLVVPFGYAGNTPSCGDEQFVQLIDLAGDALVARGLAHQDGVVRRTLVEDGILLGISDLEVRAFDLSDRDFPAAVGIATVGRERTTVCSGYAASTWAGGGATFNDGSPRGCSGAGGSPSSLFLALAAIFALRRGGARVRRGRRA